MEGLLCINIRSLINFIWQNYGELYSKILWHAQSTASFWKGGAVHSTWWKYSTSWKHSLYFVSIFRTGWNFLIFALFTNSWHEMNFKLSLVYILINEVGQWFYLLDHVVLSKNIFWFVKLYIVRLPNLFHPNVNFKLVERLAFLVRCCTSESISKKSHVITLMMLSIDAIY